MQRPAFVRYGSLAIGGTCGRAGRAFFRELREAPWALAAAINLLAEMRTGGGEWSINPVHFAGRQRCS